MNLKRKSESEERNQRQSMDTLSKWLQWKEGKISGGGQEAMEKVGSREERLFVSR